MNESTRTTDTRPVPTHTAPQPGPAPLDPRRWWMLGAVGVAQLMVSLDATVMNVALPSVQQELGFSDGLRSWILTSYTLAFGSLLLIGGRLADRFGRRRMILFGLIGFGLVSIVGGFALDFGMLTATRAAQGVFAAALVPGALALVTTTFPSGPERARAFGVYGAISVAGGALGLVIGGALTEFFSWRSTMFVNVLFAIPAAIAVFILVKPDRATRRMPLDWFGTLAVSAGLFALVYGFTNAGEDSWTSPLTVTLLIGGVALLTVFVFWQTRSQNPLLPLRVFADRDRAAGLISMFAGIAGMLAVIMLCVFYVQEVLGWTALQTGIAFLPQPVITMVVGVLVGPRLIRQFGPKIIAPVGLLLAAVAILMLTSLDGTSNYAVDILPTLVILGVGLGLFFPLATGLATRGLRVEDAGVGSALVSTVQQVGGSIGIAVINTITATSAVHFAETHAPTATLARDAMVHGDVSGLRVAAFVFIGGAIVAALAIRGRGAPVLEPRRSEV